ncbi:hypothetical protein DBT_0253 [Dissulfuribacter thermophilus]|uniref:DNA 3'-5' helicase II n=1 Tax=Dissulfuribacter thermophilus TaxID=1156395 RepID=A0A1B9F936_9BACT|nr:hypothetical protein DBT_0253 [Dissulfuribacter thermophilus]
MDVNINRHDRSAHIDFRGLNESQQRAVFFDEARPLVVIAGPGTGKTKVLAHRVVYLLCQKNIPPKTFLP